MNEVTISKQTGFISKKDKNDDKCPLGTVYYICINTWIRPEKAAEQLNMCLADYVDKLTEYGACFVLNSSHMGFGFHTEKEAKKFIKEFVEPKLIIERLRRAK